MLDNIVSSLAGSLYGVARPFLSIAAKVFIVYGGLVLLMAFASDRLLDGFIAYAKPLSLGVLAHLVRNALDKHRRRG